MTNLKEELETYAGRMELAKANYYALKGAVEMLQYLIMRGDDVCKDSETVSEGTDGDQPEKPTGAKDK